MISLDKSHIFDHFGSKITNFDKTVFARYVYTFNIHGNEHSNDIIVKYPSVHYKYTASFFKYDKIGNYAPPEAANSKKLIPIKIKYDPDNPSISLPVDYVSEIPDSFLTIKDWLFIFFTPFIIIYGIYSMILATLREVLYIDI